MHLRLHLTEIIEMIQMDGNSATSEKSKTAPVVPPVRPPHKYLPFHPACKLYVRMLLLLCICMYCL